MKALAGLLNTLNEDPTGSAPEPQSWFHHERPLNSPLSREVFRLCP